MDGPTFIFPWDSDILLHTLDAIANGRYVVESGGADYQVTRLYRDVGELRLFGKPFDEDPLEGVGDEVEIDLDKPLKVY